MNQERLLRQAELAELKDEFQRQELLGDSLLVQFRLACDPARMDFIDLDMEELRARFTSLEKSWRKARELVGRIEKLQDALGI